MKLGKNNIQQQTETKHLGIIRNDKNKVNIEDRLNIGRKTIYATLGPGFHARKGMTPAVALKIWKTYALPRCLYGIEVTNYMYTKTDIQKLEQLQRQVYR